MKPETEGHNNLYRIFERKIKMRTTPYPDKSELKL